MFDKIATSWEFAKQSYGMLWQHKSLLLFPIVSLLGTTLVLLTFLFPMGVLEAIGSGAQSQAGQTMSSGGLAVLGFLYYVANYFVVVFFNAGLVACTYQVLEGDEPSVGHGFAVASRRAPQILGWSVLSAIVSTILNALEENEKVGAFISSIIGMAWAAMTYFVIPIIVVDGEGPISAIKSSMETLKDTWGTALVGNFSMGLIGFLISIPGGLLIFLGMQGSTLSIPLIVLGGIWIVLAVVAQGAADAVFKAMLYEYATGAQLDASVDTHAFDNAFRSRGSGW